MSNRGEQTIKEENGRSVRRTIKAGAPLAAVPVVAVLVDARVDRGDAAVEGENHTPVLVGSFAADVNGGVALANVKLVVIIFVHAGVLLVPVRLRHEGGARDAGRHRKRLGPRFVARIVRLCTRIEEEE